MAKLTRFNKYRLSSLVLIISSLGGLLTIWKPMGLLSIPSLLLIYILAELSRAKFSKQRLLSSSILISLMLFLLFIHGSSPTEYLVFLNYSLISLFLLSGVKFQVNKALLILCLFISIVSGVFFIINDLQDASTPVIVTLITGTLIIHSNTVKRKVFYLLILIVFAILSESRASLLVGVSYSAYIFLYDLRKWRILGLTFLLILSIPILIFSTGVDGDNTGDNAAIAGVNINTAGRINVWTRILEKEMPMSGIGRSLPVELYGTRWAHPHNEFLRFYLIWGWIGVIAIFTQLRNIYIELKKVNSTLLLLPILMFCTTDNWYVFTFAIVFLLINIKNSVCLEIQKSNSKI